MKRWLSAIMIAVMLLSCILGTYAMAEDAGQKVKATGSVNVRSGPGLNYKSLGTIKKGKKTWNNSKTYKRDRAKLADIKRKNAASR